jgi:glutaminase
MAGVVRHKLSAIACGALTTTQTTKRHAAGERPKAASVAGVAVHRLSSPTSSSAYQTSQTTCSRAAWRGATGAVVSQVLNVYLRAVAVEMKVKEVGELEERLASLEEASERGKHGGRRWG